MKNGTQCAAEEANTRRRGVRLVLVIAAVAVLLLLALGPHAYRSFPRYPHWPSWAAEYFESRLARALACQRTRDIQVDVELFPELRGLRAHATLQVDLLDRPAGRLCFLLNPGLSITGASVDGTAVSASSWGEVVDIALPDVASKGDSLVVEMDYEGIPQSTSFQEVRIEPTEVILPRLALWYPSDLTSFSPMKLKVTLPVGLDLVTPCACEEESLDFGRKTVTWRPSRPVVAVPLIAGRYDVVERTHGSLRCRLYWPTDTELKPGEYIEPLGAASNNLRSLLGQSGFAETALVVSSGLSGRLNAGASVLLVPKNDSQGEHERFVEMARLLAEDWWGGTLTPRWFSERPEAGAWLTDGLAEYCAWEALRRQYGRGVLLAHLEKVRQGCAIAVPLGTVGPADAARAPSLYDELVREHGARVALVLSEWLEPETFFGACANFFDVHRYEAISLAAFRQELELASDEDLEEYFRVWFDRTGTYDHAVADVAADGDRVRIALENNGDMPVLTDVRLAIVTDAGVEIRKVGGGALEASFLLDVTSPVRRVILDPFLSTPDCVRANNVWPRRSWPAGLAVNQRGDIAVTSRTDWVKERPDSITVIPADAVEGDRLELTAPLDGPPAWSPDGESLAFSADRPYLWRGASGSTQVSCAETYTVAGWLADELVLIRGKRRERGSRWLLMGQGETRKMTTDAAPLPATLAGHPSGGVVAFVSRDDATLSILDRVSGLYSLTPAVGGPVWTPDGASLLFMDTSGRLMRCRMSDSGRWYISDMVLDVGYPVISCRFSEDARYVAWMDRPGQLRMARLAEPTPRVVGPRLSVAAYAWEGSSALVCLATENNWALPSRFHADYSLWRVPVDSLTPTRMNIDPDAL